jgi:hypothetical protein
MTPLEHDRALILDGLPPPMSAKKHNGRIEAGQKSFRWQRRLQRKKLQRQLKRELLQSPLAHQSAHAPISLVLTEENQASSNDDDEDDDDGSGDSGGDSEEEEEEEPVCTDCGEQPCMFEEFIPNLIALLIKNGWLDMDFD